MTDPHLAEDAAARLRALEPRPSWSRRRPGPARPNCSRSDPAATGLGRSSRGGGGPDLHQQGGHRDARPHPGQPGNGRQRQTSGDKSPSPVDLRSRPGRDCPGPGARLAAPGPTPDVSPSPPWTPCGTARAPDALPVPFRRQPGIADDAAPHYRSAAAAPWPCWRTKAATPTRWPPPWNFSTTTPAAWSDCWSPCWPAATSGCRTRSRSGDAGLRAEAEAALAALVGRDLATAADLIGPRDQEALLAGARYAAAQLAATRPRLSPSSGWKPGTSLTGDLADLPAWRALGQLLLTNDGRLRARLDVRQGFPPTPPARRPKAALQEAIDALSAAAGDALAQLREAPAPVFGDAEWATVLQLLRLLNLATAQLWLAFQEAGAVDLPKWPCAPSPPSAPRRRLPTSPWPSTIASRHLLVDEFQDTSPTQAGLIAGLTRGWGPTAAAFPGRRPPHVHLSLPQGRCRALPPGFATPGWNHRSACGTGTIARGRRWWSGSTASFRRSFRLSTGLHGAVRYAPLPRDPAGRGGFRVSLHPS